MPRWISHTRAATQAAAALLCAALLLGPALLAPSCALAAGAGKAKGNGESLPLNLSPTTKTSASGSTGSDLVRTIVGLAIVIAVIWGITWVLRQVKNGREGKAAGAGLTSLASLPLGSGRSMHLIRAGSDYVLVGVGEQGVVPIHRYSEQQARDAGLLGLGSGNPMLADDIAATTLPVPGVQEPAGLLDRVRRWTVRA